MAKTIALRGQLVLLIRVRGGRLDLGELEPEQVEVPLASPLAVAKLGELAADRAHLHMSFAVPRPSVEVLGACEAIEDL